MVARVHVRVIYVHAGACESDVCACVCLGRRSAQTRAPPPDTRMGAQPDTRTER